MTDTVIRVEDLSKLYRLGRTHDRHDTIRDHLTHRARSLFRRHRGGNLIPGSHPVTTGQRASSSDQTDTIWALDGVSFEVKRGEILGIVGRNGAGKSTLLKILSRITEPTRGRAELHGRIGSLLEVGTGFHPELTGRDNIWLYGAILGMNRTEIQRDFDAIVDFAEIEKFIDTPVKHYSSGMYIRLAFAVAAHLDVDLLFADEVLAVGDLAFRRKCLGKMKDVATAGRTVMFVSHDLASVQSLCPRVILLRLGRLAHDGPTDVVVREYLAQLNTGTDRAFTNNPERSGSGAVRLTWGEALDELRQPSRYLVAGRPAYLSFRYENRTGVKRANILLTIYNHLGVAVTHFDMASTRGEIEGLLNEGVIACQISMLPLPIGQYRVAIAVQINGENADHIPNAILFEVTSSVFYPSGKTPDINHCTCMIAHAWSHTTMTNISK